MATLFFCVYQDMEDQEIILLVAGLLISVLGYFLKKESAKMAETESRVSELEVTLAKNEVRDSERWKQSQRLLEERRKDVRKIFDILQSDGIGSKKPN